MFEPLRAIDALNEHDVQFVVVGGWGSLQHGATRLTQDLDVCPELGAASLERLGRALTSLHAELLIAPGQTVPVPVIDARLLSRMQIANWNTDAGGLDVLHGIPSGTAGATVGYDELRRDATEVRDGHRAYVLASLVAITESKRAAGRPKDQEALPELDRLVERQRAEGAPGWAERERHPRRSDSPPPNHGFDR